MNRAESYYPMITCKSYSPYRMGCGELVMQEFTKRDPLAGLMIKEGQPRWN
jgi:hypothetical protein